jgi:hypothetical protein
MTSTRARCLWRTFFYRTETFELLYEARFLPELHGEVKEIHQKTRVEWFNMDCSVKTGSGHANSSVVCISPFFFTYTQEFLRHFPTPNSIPDEFDVLRMGFKELAWRQIMPSRNSKSPTLFPIEDEWHAMFYASIGQFIPQHLTFCQEYVAPSDNRVDFVLRNRQTTRAIEFLTQSRDVAGHHERFERGAYNSLKLSGAYLVVDIKAWG